MSTQYDKMVRTLRVGKVLSQPARIILSYNEPLINVQALNGEYVVASTFIKFRSRRAAERFFNSQSAI